MAVTDAQLLLKLSTGSAAGSGNAAGSTPAASLGGQISTTVLTNNSLHNLFDAVTGDENAALENEYRLLFIHNSNATDTAGPNGKLWLFTDTPAGAADIAIALDGTGVTALAAATAQSEAVANENTAPTGESFTSPLTKVAGITLPNLLAGQVLPVWIRRTTANGGARSSVTVALRAEWDVL
jgi:hypothetical protein